MRALRTPDERFENLPGFPYQPRYVDVDGLRMAYIDEGEGPAVLLLHGEPTWSYLYRHMIAPLVTAGFRAIAPDLIGFGRSDKPARISDYSYAGHIAWMQAFVNAMDLKDATLVCQDWGSLIGLRVALAEPDRFAGIVLANGGLPTGHEKFPRAFKVWRAFARWSPWFPIGRIVASGCATDLAPEVVAAYDAPFPNASYKAGTRAFPRLVPTRTEMPEAANNCAAWSDLERWDKPFLTAFSTRDPITRGGDRPFQQRVPGAQGEEHATIHKAGHFLQEDRGEELAAVIIDFMNRHRSRATAPE